MKKIITQKELKKHFEKHFKDNYINYSILNVKDPIGKLKQYEGADKSYYILCFETFKIEIVNTKATYINNIIHLKYGKYLKYVISPFTIKFLKNGKYHNDLGPSRVYFNSMNSNYFWNEYIIDPKKYINEEYFKYRKALCCEHYYELHGRGLDKKDFDKIYNINRNLKLLNKV